MNAARDFPITPVLEGESLENASLEPTYELRSKGAVRSEEPGGGLKRSNPMKEDQSSSWGKGRLQVLFRRIGQTTVGDLKIWNSQSLRKERRAKSPHEREEKHPRPCVIADHARSMPRLDGGPRNLNVRGPEHGKPNWGKPQGFDEGAAAPEKLRSNSSYH